MARDLQPASLQKHLTGIDYPAQKDEILEVAQENNAPRPVIEQIRNLPDRRYEDVQEIMDAVGRR